MRYRSLTAVPRSVTLFVSLASLPNRGQQLSRDHSLYERHPQLDGIKQDVERPEVHPGVGIPPKTTPQRSATSAFRSCDSLSLRTATADYDHKQLHTTFAEKYGAEHHELHTLHGNRIEGALTCSSYDVKLVRWQEPLQGKR